MINSYHPKIGKYAVLFNYEKNINQNKGTFRKTNLSVFYPLKYFICKMDNGDLHNKYIFDLQSLKK